MPSVEATIISQQTVRFNSYFQKGRWIIVCNNQFYDRLYLHKLCHIAFTETEILNTKNSSGISRCKSIFRTICNSVGLSFAITNRIPAIAAVRIPIQQVTQMVHVEKFVDQLITSATYTVATRKTTHTSTKVLCLRMV